ncbi:bifunctional glycosyltransferase family 2/GtrA family protein [Microbacterium hominis]|uniref:Bifunctional glycosyltransferase family 2/GtrA family protein n=1 Tax=Microbacterium hominis TaxID=162426 RepID=A0A7D4Q032_9MICO|nr:bifunctional glycosyltransferase family 2/GtrA family protein [Microbacterium hominis]QKJ18872.1 bifunctional glycosyltransferase family 2/GtrA family protein [Microbacterium hominis]
MIVLIPAYEPGARLVALVAALTAADPDVEIVVVDDGSGSAFASVFDAAAGAGAVVLRHDANGGKGAALKIGFAYALAAHPGEGVVTADADGQHTAADILRVADELREDAATGAPTLILGCRGFTGTVPLRSRAGNAVSRGLFRVAAGWTLSDTQTGLRGIPSPHLAWMLQVPGDRFEYEQNMLLRCRGAGIRTREVPIETVYLEDNASSHFRPLIDSARVVLPVVLFAGSSMLAFLIDTLVLLALTALTGSLVWSIVVARLVSASANFAVNRRVVFRRHGRGAAGQAVRYGLLAVALLASNIVWMQALTEVGVPLVVAKIATELVLFVTSYGVQRTFVFRAGASASERPSEFGDQADARHRNRIGSPTRMESHPITTGRTP